MKTRNVVTLSLCLVTFVGIASPASAQDLRRSEVRQQLIDAESNGSRFISDASYPDVNPAFTQHIVQVKKRVDGVGGSTSSTSVAGARSAMAPTECIGPISFCTTYFGS